MAQASDAPERNPPVPETDSSPDDAFHEAAGYLRELKAYASYFLSAKMDSVRLTVRRIVIYAILGTIAVVLGLTLLVMAVVLAMQGLADLISWALHFAYPGLSPWIGPLIVGFGVVVALAFTALVIVPHQFRVWRQRTVQKYEQKRRQQRFKSGRDVHERAAEK